ncbi:ABC transporter ATP-binding protein [Brachybacterium sp. EF45031]|uniref:ABC transporter ATP-binding protein n=1 Tax=Brachybacterium sillae TaxID=2810536 RepID=UPI00217DDC79|nr:ABC transporter ATP-binding protein [Brachybacterium sillae]MCS6711494.1 ABC transporter ATP-binding protein [Brachybacterium sillae]
MTTGQRWVHGEDPSPLTATAVGTAPTGPPGAPAPTPAVEVRGASRAFGTVQAVQGLDLVAPRGSVTALVGPNGCGKSTLMLMLVGLLAPDSGEVRVLGHDPMREGTAVRARVGWMPDQFGAWDSLTVREVLYLVGRACFLPRDQVRLRAEALLERLDLTALAATPAHVLSRGQKQRLGLARALMPGPELLVLDEPASGLDPASRRRLLQIVRGFAADGGSVLISSHILSELEEMADQVVMMDRGRVVDAASVRGLAQRPRPWRVAALDATGLHSALQRLQVRVDVLTPPSESTSGHAEAEMTLPDDRTAARLLRDLLQEGTEVVSFAPATGRLEAAYLSTDAARREGAL